MKRRIIATVVVATVVGAAVAAPGMAQQTHVSHVSHSAGKRDDVPWCNPNMSKPRRNSATVRAWAGVHCSVDWSKIWWWVQARMYSHVSKRMVPQGSTKIHFNDRPTRFHADTAIAHCRWSGYGKGTGGGANTERIWQTFLRVDGILAQGGDKIRMYDEENTLLHCVGYVAR